MEPRIGERVLAFYQELPFNFHGSPALAAESIRRCDPLDDYPILRTLVRPGLPVADVGCGTGWLVNGLAFHARCRGLGVDFNPVAVARAREVAAELEVQASFRCEDLFRFRPEAPFPLVISLGALHHTGDCHSAIRTVCDQVVADQGHLLLGLYHRHGRAPFLEHFSALRDGGATEAELFGEFQRMMPDSGDTTFLSSWFRDQVLHPHETRHTVEEITEVLEPCGMKVLCSSLNGFGPVLSGEALRKAELGLGSMARERLAQGRYFPGFFVILARKGVRS